jgi:hypothetical protein
MYTILSFGINAGSNLAITGGYGIGRQFNIGKRISVNPELTANQLYLGDFEYTNGFFRFETGVHYTFSKYLSAYIAPSYNYCYIDQTQFPTGYRNDIPNVGFGGTRHNKDWTSWIGWSVGISIF